MDLGYRVQNVLAREKMRNVMRKAINDSATNGLPIDDMIDSLVVAMFGVPEDKPANVTSECDSVDLRDSNGTASSESDDLSIERLRLDVENLKLKNEHQRLVNELARSNRMVRREREKLLNGLAKQGLCPALNGFDG